VSQASLARQALRATLRAAATERVAALLVVAAATALVYSNSFDATFHFDDYRSIVQDPSLRDLGAFWPPAGSRWLGRLSFALNHRLGGLDPFGYHLANVLVHLANGLLVTWLAAITLRTPALRRAEMDPALRRFLPLAAGLLFAVHPLQTQAVTYVVQRFTSLATFFYLLALVLHAQARLALEEERPLRLRAAVLYLLSVMAAAAAMETKQIAFTLPLVAAGYELLLFGASRRLLLLAPLGATALLVPLGMLPTGATLTDVLAEPGRLTAEAPDISRSVYLLTQLRVVATYLRMLVLPVGQSLDHDVPLSRSLAEPAVLAGLGVHLALAASAVLLLRQARRTSRGEGILVFLGIAWFYATLSVESSVIPIRDVMAEHRVYLPSAGAALALGTALLWVVGRVRSGLSPAARVAAALLVTAGPLGAATWARNLAWKDELALWSDVVSKSPGKARPHSDLGDALTALGRSDDATREYLEAIRLDPGYAKAHANLANILQAKGLLDDALHEYLEAIRLEPELAEAHKNLGNVYFTRGRIDDAIREQAEAVRLAPWMAEAHNDLGVAWTAKGRPEVALAHYREAIRLDPSMRVARLNLGVACAAAGRLDEALLALQEAVRLDPLDPRPHRALGDVFRARGLHEDAVREWGDAIRLGARAGTSPAIPLR
jgi:tetratricopeptide (TPR) repeat protein